MIATYNDAIQAILERNTLAVLHSAAVKMGCKGCHGLRKDDTIEKLMYFLYGGEEYYHVPIKPTLARTADFCSYMYTDKNTTDFGRRNFFIAKIAEAICTYSNLEIYRFMNANCIPIKKKVKIENAKVIIRDHIRERGLKMFSGMNVEPSSESVPTPHPNENIGMMGCDSYGLTPPQRFFKMVISSVFFCKKFDEFPEVMRNGILDPYTFYVHIVDLILKKKVAGTYYYHHKYKTARESVSALKHEAKITDDDLIELSVKPLPCHMDIAEKYARFVMERMYSESEYKDCLFCLDNGEIYTGNDALVRYWVCDKLRVCSIIQKYKISDIYTSLFGLSFRTINSDLAKFRKNNPIPNHEGVDMEFYTSFIEMIHNVDQEMDRKKMDRKKDEEKDEEKENTDCDGKDEEKDKDEKVLSQGYSSEDLYDYEDDDDREYAEEARRQIELVVKIGQTSGGITPGVYEAAVNKLEES